MKQNQGYLSIAELSAALGISRIAVFKQIQQGKIFAQKAGRKYIIPLDFVQKHYPHLNFSSEKSQIQISSPEEYVSVVQLAKELGLSRIAVYQRMKKGEFTSIRVGRSFLILRKSVDIKSASLKRVSLRRKESEEIQTSINKIFEDFHQTIKLLGSEL